jgi:tRNA threonylcarbamoyladenosine biosynthesis protein TsaE
MHPELEHSRARGATAYNPHRARSVAPMSILEPLAIECTSHSEAQTQRLGMRLGTVLPRHAIITLQGSLGAGKTSFARGIGIGWGADQLLRSPTFTLIQAHRRPTDDAVLYHIDLYRVASDADLLTLGLEDALSDQDGIAIIEWPERIADLIPPSAIRVKFEIMDETHRQIKIVTQDAQTWQVLLKFRKLAFGV